MFSSASIKITYVIKVDSVFFLCAHILNQQKQTLLHKTQPNLTQPNLT